MSRIFALAREPLVHFLIIGAALFLLFDLTRDPVATAARPIVVGEGVVEQLAAQFSRTWLRPPAEAELEGLIAGYVREEVYYREALALGLDRDDRVVRQRMRQKLEFLLEDLAVEQEPGDAALQAFLARHPERFRVPPRMSFQHVYLNPDRREDLQAETTRLLQHLRGGASPDSQGDPFMLGHAFSSVTPHEIARLFGAAFADRVVTLEEGTWHGPVDSGLGRHLVHVESREPGHLPQLDEVRQQVEREWLDERRRAQKEAAYRKLREGYEVVVERPKALEAPAGTQAAELTGR